ncbi:cyclic nucleotide-binding domain-containing protein [Kutzneria viridogrisea]|uniref:Cyclic nucleotide-binding domain-containing protein n=2 Tax=Kutzneria TaxID=43356 RepID=W5WH64_9PSEU|nr:Crp/Fnr family transcriptional regulator [Kutzneria albida]AHH97514.1 hypothetical protein KALB_4150 [Kutzneria albida DSM 43870]MBA8930548.1 CRP-like cAMP-binding protein [Kutzneria viridogrisea]
MRARDLFGEGTPFAGLAESHLEVLARAAREVSFAEGQRLFEEGAPAVGCWVVRRGCVAVDTVLPGQAPGVVQTLGPGQVVGWSWLVPPYRWHFGAVAVTPTLAVELDTEQLRAWAEHDPSFGYPVAMTLLATLLERLQATRARLLDLYGRPHER